MALFVFHNSSLSLHAISYEVGVEVLYIIIFIWSELYSPFMLVFVWSAKVQSHQNLCWSPRFDKHNYYKLSLRGLHYIQKDKWLNIVRNRQNTVGSNNRMTNLPLNYFGVCLVNILYSIWQPSFLANQSTCYKLLLFRRYWLQSCTFKWL